MREGVNIKTQVFVIITALFAKFPRPGDSEGTFRTTESSCHLLAVYHTVNASHCPFIAVERRVESFEHRYHFSLSVQYDLTRMVKQQTLNPLYH